MQIFKQQNAVKNAFFDYSLWNHYVNVHLPLFLALRQWAVYLIFLSIFLLCTIGTFLPLKRGVNPSFTCHLPANPRL